MHAIYHARVAKRFSLLLLDDEEDYVGDWGVDCTRWPPEVPGNWMLQQQRMEGGAGAGATTTATATASQQPLLPGRLRLCTKSMFFEPDDVRVPIVRISFADVTRLEPDDSAFQEGLEQQQMQQQQWQWAGGGGLATAASALTTARRAPPAAFVVATTSVTRMRPGLQDVPYATDRAGRAAAAGAGMRSAAAAAAAASANANANANASASAKEFVWSFSLRYAKLDSLLPPAMEQLAISRLPPLERLQVRSAAAAARQDEARFDPSRLADLGEAVLWEGPAEQRSPLVREPGRLAVSSSRLYFQPLHDVDGSGPVRSHPLAAVAAVARRRASLRPTGVEVFFLQPPFGGLGGGASGGADNNTSSSSSSSPALSDDTRRALAEGPYWDAPSAFFALRREADRDAFARAISARPVLGAAAALSAGLGGRVAAAGGGGASAAAPAADGAPAPSAAAVSPSAALAAARELLEASGGWLPRATAAWRRGAVSNFDYLLLLNLAAGRSFNDLAQWPVFPWVLADYAPQQQQQPEVGGGDDAAAAPPPPPPADLGDLSDPSLFRDLSKPVGALTAERLADFRARYRDMLQIERAHAAAKQRERDEARRRRAAAAAEKQKKSKKKKGGAKADDGDDDNEEGEDDDKHDPHHHHDHHALPEVPPAFMYGTHYSAPGYVLYWLVRACPAHMLRLQGGRFDAPDRLFCSVAEAWRSVTTSTTDVKELIPEFYVLPSPAVARSALAQLEAAERGGGGRGAGGDNGGEAAAAAAASAPRDGAVDFLAANPRLALGVRQSGRPVGAVELPRWAKGSPALFLATMRAALEAPPVSAGLHRWIDLVFGCRQRGSAAAEADNVFYYLTYEGAVDVDRLSSPLERRALETQVDEFGQAPRQLFAREHPPRLVRPAAPRPADLLRAVAEGGGLAAAGGGGDGGGHHHQQQQQQDAGGRALALSLLNSIVAAAAPEMAAEAEALARAEAEAAAAAAAAEEERGGGMAAVAATAASADDAATDASDADPTTTTAASSSRLTGLRGALEGAVATAAALASAAAAGLDAAASATPPPPPPRGSLLATLQYSFARGVTAAAAAQGAAGAAFLSGPGVAGRPRRTPAPPPSTDAAAAAAASPPPPPPPDAATGCRLHAHPPPPPPPQGSGGGDSGVTRSSLDWPPELGERLRVRRAVRLSLEGEPLTAALGLGGGGGGGGMCAVAGRRGVLRLLRLPELEAATGGAPPGAALPLPAGTDPLCLAALSQGGDAPALLLAGGASGRVCAVAVVAGAGSAAAAAQSWAAHRAGTAVRVLLALPGARLASAGDDGTVRVWDACARAPWAAAAGAAAAAPAPPAPLLQLAVDAAAPPSSSAVRCLAASSSGQTLVVGSADGSVSLWDLRTGRRAWGAATGAGGGGGGAAGAASAAAVNGVAVVSGGAYVAAAAANGKLSLHDWRVGGARVAAVQVAAAVAGGSGGSGGAAALRCLASDGRLVLAGGDGGRLHLWDAAAAAAAGAADAAAGGGGGGGTTAGAATGVASLLCGSRAAVNAVVVFPSTSAGGGGAARAVAVQDDGYLALFST